MEPGPRGFERGTLVIEVVAFPVEHDRQSAILGVHGLTTTLEIDDGQTSHAQGGGTVDVHTFGIRSSVLDRIAHGLENGWVGVLAIQPDVARDSAHRDSLSLPGSWNSWADRPRRGYPVARAAGVKASFSEGLGSAPPEGFRP